MRKIILTFKTHFDIGFTDLSEVVLNQYAGEQLETLLDTCEQTKSLGDCKFIWTMPAMPLCEMLKRCTDQARPRLESLIKHDRIAWHALAHTMHTDFVGLDELRASFHYAKDLCDKYNKPMPKSAKMSDVPGHGRILPSILAAQGVEFLHLGSNEFARSPSIPTLFYWEAPDGKRVLTMYSEHAYGAAEPPENWDLPVWLSFQHTNDNLGPQTADGIKKIVSDMQQKYPDAQIVSGTLDDFYRELQQLDLSHLPVIKQDLADSWIHGVGTFPVEVGIVRACRRRAQALLGMVHPEELIPVYDELALFAEHTWGLDVKTWLPGDRRVYEKSAFNAIRQDKDYQYLEASWDEQRERAHKAAQLLDDLEEKYSVARRSIGEWGGDALLVETEGVVSIVRNHRYALRFDADHGRVLGVFDLQLDKQILGADAFSYRYDVYGKNEVDKYLKDYCSVPSAWGVKDNGRENYPDCAHQTFAPKFIGYAIEGRDLVLRYHGTATKDFGDANEICIRITLPEAGDELPVSLSLVGKQATPYIESGSFVMPLAMDDPDYRLHKNGQWIDPKVDIADYADHALYCIEDLAQASQDGATVSVEVLDTPLLAIGETGIYIFRKQYEQHAPAFYFNLFNNQWGTNFPQWIEGDISFSFIVKGIAE